VWLVITKVSEEHVASIIRVKRISELGTTTEARCEGMHVVFIWFVSPWWWRWHVPPKRQFSQEPHGITSQKMSFFIVTTVKTSNLTSSHILTQHDLNDGTLLCCLLSVNFHVNSKSSLHWLFWKRYKLKIPFSAYSLLKICATKNCISVTDDNCRVKHVLIQIYSSDVSSAFHYNLLTVRWCLQCSKGFLLEQPECALILQDQI
jgi:hypothetical protein